MDYGEHLNRFGARAENDNDFGLHVDLALQILSQPVPLRPTGFECAIARNRCNNFNYVIVGDVSRTERLASIDSDC
jgi:hypothetical protein